MSKLKRNYIKLVEGKEDNGEPILVTYLTPHHIPLDVLYACIDVLDELDDMEKKNEESDEPIKQSKLMRTQIELLMDAVVKIYGGQFTKKQLIQGIHAPEVNELLEKQVKFIASGQQDEETKKFMESQR